MGPIRKGNGSHCRAAEIFFHSASLRISLQQSGRCFFIFLFPASELAGYYQPSHLRRDLCAAAYGARLEANSPGTAVPGYRLSRPCGTGMMLLEHSLCGNVTKNSFIKSLLQKFSQLQKSSSLYYQSSTKFAIAFFYSVPKGRYNL
jgi:hypothetical protein